MQRISLHLSDRGGGVAGGQGWLLFRNPWNCGALHSGKLWSPPLPSATPAHAGLHQSTTLGSWVALCSAGSPAPRRGFLTASRQACRGHGGRPPHSCLAFPRRLCPGGGRTCQSQQVSPDEGTAQCGWLGAPIHSPARGCPKWTEVFPGPCVCSSGPPHFPGLAV